MPPKKESSKKQKANMKKIPTPKKKNPWIIMIAIVILFTLFSVAFNPESKSNKAEEVSITAFQRDVAEGKFERIEMTDQGEEIFGFVKKEDGVDEKNQKVEKTVKLSTATLESLGFTNLPEGTDLKVVSKATQRSVLSILGSILPILLIMLIVFFFMGRANKGGGSPFSFSKSKAREFDSSKKKTTFAEVAGAEEAKEELIEIVDFLKKPKKYTKMGAKIPRGVLLVGSPGTGKTLLARAVAGEANVPFFSISGSEFVEMFVGVGASRVRDLFEKAKKNAPAIIFIDEIDAIGKQRGGGGMGGGGNDEREQTLNQILTEMDGFEGDTNVIIMAATNRPDILDKALLRPGRFDRRVVIDPPDIKAREEILKVHGKNKPLAKNIDLAGLAKVTVGMSGADLENLMNEAAILTARENRKKITNEDLSRSMEKVTLGRERKSMVMKPEAKKKTAYHETGHAMMAKLLPNCDPVHKLTIISRGMALGVTWTMPDEDSYSVSHSKFLDDICMLLGGYAAEELIYGEHETGVSNDLKVATQKARSMATRYGMAPELGPVSLADAEDHAGFESFGLKSISDETAHKVDEFVRTTIESCLTKTKTMLKENKDILEAIAARLMEIETLDRKAFEAFFPTT